MCCICPVGPQLTIPTESLLTFCYPLINFSAENEAICVLDYNMYNVHIHCFASTLYYSDVYMFMYIYPICRLIYQCNAFVPFLYEVHTVIFLLCTQLPFIELMAGSHCKVLFVYSMCLVLVASFRSLNSIFMVGCVWLKARAFNISNFKLFIFMRLVVLFLAQLFKCNYHYFNN